jgi:hypothetical protein
MFEFPGLLCHILFLAGLSSVIIACTSETAESDESKDPWCAG